MKVTRKAYLHASQYGGMTVFSCEDMSQFGYTVIAVSEVSFDVEDGIDMDEMKRQAMRDRRDSMLRELDELNSRLEAS